MWFWIFYLIFCDGVMALFDSGLPFEKLMSETPTSFVEFV